jgi:hypothetical protein
MAIQFDLFEETSDIDILKQELAEVRSRNENVRKGIFARHNELCKMYISLKEEVESLKKNAK